MPDGNARGAALRFGDAVAIRSQLRIAGVAAELHATAPVVGDCRQVELAAVEARQVHDRGRIRFAIVRGVHGDVSARSQQLRASEDASELSRRTRALVRRQGATSPTQLSAQQGSIGRRGGATRMCRHEPLLSTRSNRWDAAATAKAFRSRRTCTPLPRDRIPGVFTLGSRGNPTHVEHRRRRHIAI